MTTNYTTGRSSYFHIRGLPTALPPEVEGERTDYTRVWRERCIASNHAFRRVMVKHHPEVVKKALRQRGYRLGPQKAIGSKSGPVLEPPKSDLPMRKSRLKGKLVFTGNVPEGPRDILRCPLTRDRRIKLIIASVGIKHGVTANEMKSPRRERRIVAARHEAMWRLLDRLPLSLPQVGRIFGGRDHSSVLHAKREHQKRRDRGGA